MSRFGQSPTVFEWNRFESLVPVFLTTPQELQSTPHPLTLSLNKIECHQPVLMNPVQAQFVNSSTTYWPSFANEPSFAQAELEPLTSSKQMSQGSEVDDTLRTPEQAITTPVENSFNRSPAPQDKAEKDKEVEDDMTIDDDSDDYEDDSMDYNDEREDSFDSPERAHGRLHRLASSKSPIIEALVFCALKGWGIELLSCNQYDISFRVTNFAEYYRMSARICSKQNPTEDEASRIKALKRWFPDFPTRRGRKDLDGEFVIHVGKGTSVDNKPRKLRNIIDKTRKLVGPSSKQTKLR